MSVDDVRAITKLETTEAMNLINAAIDDLDAMSNQDELVRERLNAIFTGAKALVQANAAREAVLKNAQNHINSVQAERDALLLQRDAVLDELHTFITQMTNGDFWDNDTSTEVYEAAVEVHNEAFWSSLPYDIADKIGGEWQFFDADLLYDVLTTFDEEEFAYGRGLAVEDVHEFRANVLTLVRQLSKKENGGS